MIRELIYFLGLQIRQNDSGIFISQSKYVNNLVKKFGLESASLVRTPMSPNVKLTIDLLGKSVDPTLYISMLSSLLYHIASRPVLEYVLDIKPTLKSLMLLLSSVSSNILNQLVTLVFGMIRTQMIFWLGILMLIVLVMLMIIRELLVGVSICEIILFHG